MARQIKDLIRMMKYQGTSLSEVRKKTFAGLKPEMSKVWSGFAVSVVVRSTWTNVWIWWKISGEPEEWWRPTQWSACPVLLRCQPPPKHYTCDWPKPNMLTTITKIIQVTKVPDMIINHPHPIMMTYDQLCRSLSLSIFTSILTNNQNNHHNDQDNRLHNTWLTS